MLSCLAETIRHINSEGSVSALFLDNDSFLIEYRGMVYVRFF